MPPEGLSCREFADFLSQYVEGELERGVRGRFEGHLEECPDCVAYLANFRETVRLGRASFAPDAALLEDAPPKLVTAILEARRVVRKRAPRS
jgi:anti-sigma factor RsiW